MVTPTCGEGASMVGSVSTRVVRCITSGDLYGFQQSFLFEVVFLSLGTHYFRYQEY